MARVRYNIKATTYDRKGKIIATANNSYEKTHPRMDELACYVGLPYKQYLHAEVLAIIRSRGKPIHKIKIERYGANGQPKTAAPCPICMQAIKEAKIKFVEYTIG